MQTFFIWKSTRYGLSETRHVVCNLDDLRETVALELSDRILYLESRCADNTDELLSSNLRSSAEDLTDDDFRWLTTTVSAELRGLRA